MTPSLSLDIMEAIEADNIQEILRLHPNFLEAQLRFCDEDGNSPLHLAAMHECMECLEAFISCPSCDVNFVNRHGRTALHLSAFRGKSKVVSRILQTPQLEKNKCSEKSLCTALYFASCGGHEKVVDLLIDAGCDPNIPTQTQSSPLIVASLVGSEAIVLKLLDHGANIHHQNEGGMTALHAAACRGYSKIVQILINRGGNADIRDKQGRAAAEMMCSKTQSEFLMFARAATLQNAITPVLESHAKVKPFHGIGVTNVVAREFFSKTRPCVGQRNSDMLRTYLASFSKTPDHRLRDKMPLSCKKSNQKLFCSTEGVSAGGVHRDNSEIESAGTAVEAGANVINGATSTSFSATPVLQKETEVYQDKLNVLLLDAKGSGSANAKKKLDSAHPLALDWSVEKNTADCPAKVQGTKGSHLQTSVNCYRVVPPVSSNGVEGSTRWPSEEDVDGPSTNEGVEAEKKKIHFFAESRHEAMIPLSPCQRTDRMKSEGEIRIEATPEECRCGQKNVSPGDGRLDCSTNSGCDSGGALSENSQRTPPEESKYGEKNSLGKPSVSRKSGQARRKSQITGTVTRGHCLQSTDRVHELERKP